MIMISKNRVSFQAVSSLWLLFIVLLGFGFLEATRCRASDWPTYRHDNRRSGVTLDSLDASRLQVDWAWKSTASPQPAPPQPAPPQPAPPQPAPPQPAPPQPAWYGPAKWDAYAQMTGLRSMRDYDCVFHTIIVGDRVYFGSSVDDSVRCLDFENGQLRWMFMTDGPVRVAPTFWDGHLYFGSDDGHAYCVNADEGKLAWKLCPSEGGTRVLTNGRFIPFWPCRTGVAINDGLAYFAMSLLPWKESFLCAVDAKTGSPHVDGGFIRKMQQETFEGPFAVSSDRLVMPRGRVAPKLFDRRDGSPQGELSSGGGSFVIVTENQQILHGPGNKRGWIIGSQSETREKIATYQNGNAMVIRGEMAYLLTDSHLIASEFVSKKNRWIVDCDHPFTLILAGETLFVGGVDSVAAMSAADGHLLWSHQVDGNVHGLSMANGRLLVSTDTGFIYAFGVGTSPAVSHVPEDSVSAAGDPTKESQAAAPRRHGSEDATTSAKRSQAVLGRWLFDLPAMRGRLVRDSAAGQHARIEGPINTEQVDHLGFLVLDGERNSVLIHEDHNRGKLPTEAFTVEARLRIDKTLPWGGIVGAFQDNGAFEKGWLLGYVDSQFCLAVNGAAGPDRLTYLKSPETFELGHWYHLAGTYDGQTMKLFVDGHEVSRSAQQSGPIQYPPKAFFEIGAYHDKDENFRMTGMLHEVALYGRAFSANEILRRSRSKNIAALNPTPLAVGPWLQFASPSTAVVRWHTAEPSPTVLEYGVGKQVTTVGDSQLTTDHEARLIGLQHNRQVSYRIRYQHEGRLCSTSSYPCDNFFNYSVSDIADWKLPAGDSVAFDQICRDAAQRVLRSTDIDRGLCLVIGCVDGRFAYHLARESQLSVVMVDTDLERVAAVRRDLVEAGIYGTRISLYHIDSWDGIPFPDQVANLVVSERLLREESSSELFGQVSRLLRPYGGTAMFGHPDGSEAVQRQFKKWFGSIPSAKIVANDQGTWATFVRRETVGHGSWTHLYGQPDNSAFGGETLQDAHGTGDLEVQWIGRPGPRYQADRNGRKPSPLAANGRLLLQGLNRIVALDTHNGSVLWSLEIPSLGRFNMPRDCGNWCMDDQFVFAAVADRCWKIRAADGKVVEFLEPVRGPESEWQYDWGYIASVDNQLIGSAVKKGSSFTSFWGNANAGWYDAQTGRVTQKVCSENLFATDKKTGKLCWSYQGGLIVNPTISLTNSKAFFVECRNAYERDKQTRRLEGPGFWKDQFLVAIDLQTGRKLWEQPIKLHPGSVVYYMANGGGKLAVVCSDQKKFFVYTFSEDNGAPAWEDELAWFEQKGDHGRHMSRPAIVGDRLYVRPAVFDLASGKKLDQLLPDGGCGTYACTSGAVIYRSSVVTMWDATTGKTSGWSRLRPDCWVSTIPACGMLLSPEAGGGCSCGSWLETSLGFRPRSVPK